MHFVRYLIAGVRGGGDTGGQSPKLVWQGTNVFVKQNLSVSAPGSLGRVQDQLIELRAVHSSGKAQGRVRGKQSGRRTLSAPRTAAATWLV